MGESCNPCTRKPSGFLQAPVDQARGRASQNPVRATTPLSGLGRVAPPARRSGSIGRMDQPRSLPLLALTLGALACAAKAPKPPVAPLAAARPAPPPDPLQSAVKQPGLLTLWRKEDHLWLGVHGDAWRSRCSSASTPHAAWASTSRSLNGNNVGHW